MNPASSGRAKRGPKIFFATIGAPFASVNSNNNGRICKSRIPATYLSRRRLSFNSPVGVSPIRCFAKLRVRRRPFSRLAGQGQRPLVGEEQGPKGKGHSFESCRVRGGGRS